jgi:hypothetical protein
MSSTEDYTAEMRQRRQALQNTSSCKYCGNTIRWEKYNKEGEKYYSWRALNAHDGREHGKCKEKMGITRQYKWKKK